MCCVFIEDIAAHALGVDYNVVDQIGAGVIEDGLEMIGCSEIFGLAGLPHQVCEIGSEGFRFNDGFGNSIDQKIGNYAGEQGAWAEGDEVGLFNGAESIFDGLWTLGGEGKFLDAQLAAADACFTANYSYFAGP